MPIEGRPEGHGCFFIKAIWVALLGIAMTAPAHAQPVPAPHAKVGDSWTFHHTGKDRMGWHDNRFTMTVDRVDESQIVASFKVVGADLPPVEKVFPPDWSRERSINGHLTVVNRPLSFPLSVGKTWKVEFAVDHPNRQHTSERLVQPYRVTGWEDVTVPAGTFHALKIEVEGEWFAAIAPATGAVASSRVDATGATALVQTQKTTPHIVSGRLYRAVWYVPGVKMWVKATDEYYSSTDIRDRYSTDELESYRVAN